MLSQRQVNRAVDLYGLPHTAVDVVELARLETQNLQVEIDGVRELEDVARSQAQVDRKEAFGERAAWPQVVGLTALSGVWLALVLVVYRLDVALLVGLGYQLAVAALVACVVVLLGAAAGMLLSDAVGVTHTLHELSAAGRVRRALVGLVLLGFFGALVAQLPAMAAERSAAQLGPATDLARRALAVEQARPQPRPASVAHQQVVLARAEERERVARRTDQRLVVLAAVGDVLFAWALPRLVGAANVPLQERRVRTLAARRRRQQAQLDLLPQQVRACLTRAALVNRLDPAEVERAVADPDGSVAPPTPSWTPAPPPPAPAPDTAATAPTSVPPLSPAPGPSSLHVVF